MTGGIVKYKLILIYLLLLAVIIPWYWPEDVDAIYFGFPLWAIVSLLAGFLVSILTAVVLLTRRSDPSGGERD